ncbi:protein MAINTENANCE OF MERISTEMS-like [Papaver somniferum]|uniref:protein MAINTENANCE OF MERISTEMS-like n=1 Tax=Papaver somniferum TaxID=3469 RepID=UPI000E6F7FEE|nr:protein MAINTENANCE OF MERISTEMS-like [Papaver somniferum]
MDTFHIPVGEMTITPNDAQLISGLSMAGKAVRGKDYVNELEWHKIYAFTKNVFGWDEDKTKSEMLVGQAKQRMFHLESLRDQFMGTKKLCDQGKEVTTERITATTHLYLLYVLGIVIFPDISDAGVKANYIKLLDLIHKMANYSWGSAILENLLNELRKYSRHEPAEGICVLCR